jgi:hypothetical protein
VGFLYELPDSLLFVVIVGATVTACLAGYALFQWLFGATITEDHRVLASTLLPVVVTVHSLLMAFSAVSVWDAFSAAELAVTNEANAVTALARDLATFGGGPSARARTLLKGYAQIVIDDEWPKMRAGDLSPAAWRQFDELFRAVAQIEPDTPRRATQLSEIWGKTNAMVQYRQERLQASRAIMPPTLWLVVLAGTFLTMVTIFVRPHSRFNVAMIMVVSCSFGLVFMFLIAMEHPFAGGEPIHSTAFANAIENIERWDRETATQ